MSKAMKRWLMRRWLGREGYRKLHNLWFLLALDDHASVKIYPESAKELAALLEPLVGK